MSPEEARQVLREAIGLIARPADREKAMKALWVLTQAADSARM